MPGCNKEVTHTETNLQLCLSMCDLFLTTSIKGLKFLEEKDMYIEIILVLLLYLVVWDLNRIAFVII